MNYWSAEMSGLDVVGSLFNFIEACLAADPFLSDVIECVYLNFMIVEKLGTERRTDCSGLI
jgi:hypothetical protein